MRQFKILQFVHFVFSVQEETACMKIQIISTKSTTMKEMKKGKSTKWLYDGVIAIENKRAQHAKCANDSQFEKHTKYENEI